MIRRSRDVGAVGIRREDLAWSIHSLVNGLLLLRLFSLLLSRLEASRAWQCYIRLEFILLSINIIIFAYGIKAVGSS